MYNSYGVWVAETKKEKQFLLEKEREQKQFTKENWAESFVYGYLNEFKRNEGIKFIRQKKMYGKIFDFWFPKQGIGIEVDGLSHEEENKKKKDFTYDKYLYEQKGIITCRVKNREKGSLYNAMDIIRKSVLWVQRRKDLGISYDKVHYNKVENMNDIVEFCKNANIKPKEIKNTITPKRKKQQAMDLLFG